MSNGFTSPLQTTARQPSRRRRAVVALALATSFVFAGCAEETGSASGEAASGDVVAAAQEQVDQYSESQADIEIEPLKARPEPGQTIAIVTCPYPTCKITTDAAQEAAETLGWQVRTYVSDITPEAFQSSFNRILQAPPDLLLYLGVLPNSIIEDQLATVKELGIPTVTVATSDPPDDTVRAVIQGPPVLSKSGELMGDAITADSGGGAKVLFVWDPNSARVFQPVKDAFEERVLAGNGSVDVLVVSAMETGKAVPSQVVSYLQANPDVEYVAFDTADFIAGVPPAMEAAGLEDVKILSRLPIGANVENLQNGDEWLEVAEELDAAGYRTIDTLARILEGSDFEERPVGWHQILTQDNVDGLSGDPVTPGFPQAFLDAWHVSEQ